MIVIVDYGMGNLNSVRRKLILIGMDAVVSSNAVDIIKADKIILPGVGHFQMAVKNIRKLNLWDVLNEIVLINKKPVLGICLGMQLMTKHSEEGDTEGFGWFDAKVIKFKVSDTTKYKVPHIGWNTTKQTKDSTLFESIKSNSEFYFVHSYHVQCNNSNDILTETIYDYPFTSAIQKDNIFGVQFHPEKSHDAGEILLRNFVNL